MTQMSVMMSTGGMQLLAVDFFLDDIALGERRERLADVEELLTRGLHVGGVVCSSLREVSLQHPDLRHQQHAGRTHPPRRTQCGILD